MGTTLGGYAPQVLGLLLGGLLASLGAVWAARSARGRVALLRVSARGAALAAVGALALGAGGAWVMLRALLAAAGAGGASPVPGGNAMIGPGQTFLFGVLVGVPLSLPGLYFAWSDAHRDEKVRVKRRDAVPTKDDRRAFADDLVRQIRDASPRPREVSASIGGEGGRVLVLTGDIDAEEGERLTAALRRDLSELGFKRVEGGGGDRDWWARV